MKYIPLTDGWTVAKTGAQSHLANGEARPVVLPHDIQTEEGPSPSAPAQAATGYFGGASATYTRRFEFRPEWRGGVVLAAFDGVMSFAEVSLNGHLVATHSYGYSPFQADLTPYLYTDRSNRLEVIANNDLQPASRWYTGTGVFRECGFLVGGKIHFTPTPFFLRTKSLDGKRAVVLTDLTATNDSSAPAVLEALVELAPEGGPVVARGRATLRLAPGETGTAALELEVPEPAPWSPDSPSLYTARATLRGPGDAALDEASETFGIRMVEVDAVRGFRLNGVPLKLKGGCVHHDNGLLGAVSLYDAEERKIRLHKENGYNAFRTAHNPPSAAFLRACDRVGMLVLDEFFDVWRMPKARNDYHRYFEKDWRSDLTASLLRDRNHPSVVFWSTGNEIPERGGLSGGYELSRTLADAVRALDPTRPVANGICSFWTGLDDRDNETADDPAVKQNGSSNYREAIWAERTAPFIAPLDVVGYNYMEGRYESDHALFPGRIIVGTESVPKRIDEVWEKVERLPYVLGDFTWTSFDYIGEAGIGRSVFVAPDAPADYLSSHASPYPWRLANDADFDICGYERPQLAYRRIVWGSSETYIAVHNPAGFGLREDVSFWGWEDVRNDWYWPGFEGKPVEVEVYSPAAEVELLLDGVSVGKAPAGKANRFRAMFRTVYRPGTLVAVGRKADGTELSRQTLVTPGAPARIVLAPERASLPADGVSLAYVRVSVTDAEGRPVPAAAPLRAEVSGVASLVAFGTGNPVTEDIYASPETTSFQGRALAILRAGARAGKTALTVSAPGLAPATAEI